MSNVRMEMKELLDAEDLLKFRTGPTYAKFSFLVAVSAGLLWAVLSVEGLWKIPVWVAFMGSTTGLVMMGHESGHGSVSTNKALNDFLGWFSFPFLAGLSMHFWKWRHNTMHHAYPNIPGKDPDVTMQPMAAHADEKGDGLVQRIAQADQAISFWPLSSLLGVAMRVDGIRFLIVHRNDRTGGAERVRDWVGIALHVVLWWVVPLQLGFTWGEVAAFYVAWTLCEGLLLAAIFSPAHIPLPLFRTSDDNFVLQLQTTQNLRTNRLFSSLMIGLDYQVEHHLFPRMSHLVTPRAGELIEQYCAKKGLPYHHTTWGKALVDTTLRMRELPGYSPEERPPRLLVDL